MKTDKFFYFLVAGFLASSLLIEPAVAQRNGAFGVGAMIGGPSGLSVKKWTSSSSAIDGGAAWSIGKDPGVQVHADYLLHRSDFEGLIENRSFAYYGVGGRVKWGEEDSRIGVRVPFGVAYHFPDAPLDAFMEVVPVFDILPETQLVLNLSIGMRFYFQSLNQPRRR